MPALLVERQVRLALSTLPLITLVGRARLQETAVLPSLAPLQKD